MPVKLANDDGDSDGGIVIGIVALSCLWPQQD